MVLCLADRVCAAGLSSDPLWPKPLVQNPPLSGGGARLPERTFIYHHHTAAFPNIMQGPKLVLDVPGASPPTKTAYPL